MAADIQARAYPHPRPRSDWLALRREAPIDPTQRIIDAHHHLWARPGEQYGIAELTADTRDGHDLRGSVFIQCGWSYRPDGPPELRPVGETEAVVAAAAAHPEAKLCQAIVGYADLRLGDAVETVLAAHVAAGAGRFRGIRQSTASDPAVLSTMSATPPAGLMADAAFRRGFARLGAMGLSYDAFLYHPQLPELVGLVRACPGTPVILDHLGSPLLVGPYRDRVGEELARWRIELRRLAELPEVVLKIGGLARTVLGFDFHERDAPPDSATLAASWRPFVEPAIEIFGARRCMFESNFPVDKGMCGYRVMWNAFQRLTEGASAEERDALFFGTAARVYRIGG